MCIIIYKPVGRHLPPYSTLKRCWDNNPHGAGFMYPYNGSVVIKKGFMEWQDFVIAIENELEQIETESIPFAIHFRIATHGGIKQNVCHPFPVTNSLKKMGNTVNLSNVGFMHNGILEGLYTEQGKSDTMSFTLNVLHPLSALCADLLTDPNANRILASSTQDCRFLLFNGSGAVKRYGTWKESEGIYYSNDSFETTRQTSSYFQSGIYDYGYHGVYDLDQESDFEAFGLFRICEECPSLEYCFECGAYCPTETVAKRNFEAGLI